MDIKNLTPRLGIIADEFKKRGIHDLFYDIGTDHAYLPIHLVTSGICETAEASDAREAPLVKARRNVEGHGLCDRIKLTVGDGFSAFSSFKPGKITVIAGIGGQNIADILETGTRRAVQSSALIIQPMNNQEILREYLAEHGYNIVYERLAREERRVYSIFVCEWVGCSDAERYELSELYTGKRVRGDTDEICHFLRFTLKKIMNRYDGLRRVTAGSRSVSREARNGGEMAARGGLIQTGGMTPRGWLTPFEELARLEEVIDAIKGLMLNAKK